MIKSKILLSLYSAFVVIFLLQFLHGPRGVEAMEDLQTYRRELEGNLKELKMNHSKLRDQFELLKTNSLAVRLTARELGFFQEGELVLKFTRSGRAENLPLSPGTIFTRDANPPFQDDFFRLSWVALFLVFYGLLEILAKMLPPLRRVLA